MHNWIVMHAVVITEVGKILSSQYWDTFFRSQVTVNTRGSTEIIVIIAR